MKKYIKKLRNRKGFTLIEMTIYKNSHLMLKVPIKSVSVVGYFDFFE